ncbi:ParB/RepB/Spo0J family partition protein [Streptomyces sp. G5(2025)]|uniref:ParB/RepB/Spo0J family partition protein n=1 Tax=Streptomyces sp. G5(2025) TaxID=3406628 RepID=UPI003C1D4AFC
MSLRLAVLTDTARPTAPTAAPTSGSAAPAPATATASGSAATASAAATGSASDSAPAESPADHSSPADRPSPNDRPRGQRATVAIGALLPSDSPRVDGEVNDHVKLLAELDAPLPPILVHRPTMRVIDGMHRLRGAELRGEKEVEVEFFDGEPEDAFALAVRLNVAHGLPLTLADRTAAASRIVAARPQWSDRRIAANTGLAASTVAAIRRRSTTQGGQSNTRMGRDGRVRPLHAAEGRRRASQIIAAHPDASLREIAQRAGIATATAKDVRDRIRLGQDPVAPKPRRPSTGATAAQTTASRAAAGRAATRTSAAAISLMLPNMGKDPSLRTEAGRALLHLLSLHAIGDEAKWSRLAQSVPVHRAGMLAQAARRCAEHWLRLAHELEMRCP